MTDEKSKLYRAFSVDDAFLDRLDRIWRILAPEIDGVLDRFYEAALGHPDMAAFFADPKVLEHAKSAQKRHWTKLFTGRFDAEYFASAERVGAVHFRIELPFLLYTSGYNRACNDMMALLLRRTQRRIGRGGPATELCQALNSVLFIDIQSVIDAYFRAQQAEQTVAFGAITDAIEGLSQGDLSVRVRGKNGAAFPARFDTIRKKFNSLCDSIESVFEHIEDSAGKVKEASTQILGSSESLSDKAQAQAAALEEAAAALTELSASVQSTRTHFDSVKSVTAENHSHADKGQHVSEQVQEAMQRIETSSLQIEEIVKSIEEISFQTNLLALNAGVEAARAGESGAGFSIVASEVRALAGRAASATESIKVLIEKNRQDITKGAGLVSESVEALNQIRVSADNVVQEIEGLYNNAGEQALAIREIENTVSHIDGTTQHNAHLASELTDHCRDLRSQADHLENPFEVFQRATGQGHVAEQPMRRVANG